jgi:hypothetical protein
VRTSATESVVGWRERAWSAAQITTPTRLVEAVAVGTQTLNDYPDKRVLGLTGIAL